MFIRTRTVKNYDPLCPNKVWHRAEFTLPKNYREIIDWCHATFGEPGFLQDSKPARWADDIWYGEVYFRDHEDLMMFVLRWS
jgi:hypothetical protein